jgi:hypothetical protein
MCPASNKLLEVAAPRGHQNAGRMLRLHMCPSQLELLFMTSYVVSVCSSVLAHLEL